MFERSVERGSGLVFLLFLPPSSSHGGTPGTPGTERRLGTEIQMYSCTVYREEGTKDLGLSGTTGFDLFEMHIFLWYGILLFLINSQFLS